MVGSGSNDQLIADVRLAPAVCRAERSSHPVLRATALVRIFRVRDDAVVHGCLPELLEIPCADVMLPMLPPGGADAFIAGRHLIVRQYRQHLVSRAALVKRLDQRLGDGGGAVEGTRVAPGFQVMRFGQMPVALPRRLILKKAQMNAKRHFLHVLAETQIGRRGEHRIAAQDYQHFDAARVHVVSQFAQRGGLIHRACFDRPVCSTVRPTLPR